MKSPAKTASRRQLLRGSAGAVAVGLSAPALAVNAPIVLRFQSTWQSKDIFHEFALDFARKVSDMSGGRLRIDVLPTGAVVKAFEVLDAVSKGRIDGGHGTLSYWLGKNTALALWTSGPAYGMDANTLLAWHEYGGGRELLAEIYARLKLDVVSLLYGPMPTQALGWFHKPVRGPEDLRGLRYRTVGLSIDMFTEMGATVNALPAPEIVSALDRGLLDAAEFNNATSDRVLGFPQVAKVCMLQSYHQPAEQFEILFNRSRFEALPRDLQVLIHTASQACSAQMSWKAIDRYSRDYGEMASQSGVKFIKTPESVLKAQLQAWDRVAERRSRENPVFARVLESQRSFARRAVRWSLDTQVDETMAFEHFFGKS